MIGRSATGRRRTGIVMRAATACTLAMLLVVLACTCYAQTTTKERDDVLRDARQLARRGNRATALKILEALYRENPLDHIVVREYSAMLVASSQYDTAEEVLRDFISRSPDDMKAVKATADLASLSFRKGDREQGRELIEGIVKRAPGQLWTYQLGLDAYIDNGMSEDVLIFIARARSALEDTTIFAPDAARVYEEQKEYAKATWEYLLSALSDGRADEASHYIVRMAQPEDARPAVLSALERAVALGSFGGAARRATWEVYLLDGACDKALDVIRGQVRAGEAGADRARPDEAAAGLMVGFGERAAEEGCFEECRQAYGLAISYAPNSSKVPYYLLKKADCEMNSGLADEALATYDEVAAKYGSTKWGSSAILERARIYRDLGRLADAAAEADRIISSERDPAVRQQTILFKGDMLVLSGDLEQAFKTYDLVSTDWEPENAQEAFFNLGEICFYRAEFDDALSYYNVTLRQYPEGLRANDALERLLVLKASGSAGSYNPALERFGKAMLDRRRGLNAEAIAGFRETAGAGSDLGTHSLIQISEIYAETGDYEKAVKTYKLVGETLDVYLSPTALEAVGDVYMGIGLVDEAVGAYENVILKYPASVSAGEARRKMDLARRDSHGS